MTAEEPTTSSAPTHRPHEFHAHDSTDGADGITENCKEYPNWGQGGTECAGHNGGARSATNIGLTADGHKEEGRPDDLGHDEQDADVHQHPEQADKDDWPIALP